MRRLLSLVALLAALPAMAQIIAPPPAVRETRAEPKQHAAAVSPQAVVTSTPYSIGDPTDEEQSLLEYVNRTRANPTAEAIRLSQETLPDIVSAYQFFSLDLNKMVTDISGLPVAPPLAFNADLIQSARVHSSWMLANAIQSHFEILGLITNSPGDRISAAGYDWQTYGESIYAFAHSAEEAQAAFEVDWGDGPGGMQNPPGHRENNHDAAFREAGVGFTHGFNTVVSALLFTNTVGPEQVTIDFGSSMTPQPLITGVAYYDVDGNKFYDVGEGLGGLTVSVAGGTQTAVTANSGGYALPSGDGTHQVTFSAPGYTSAPQSVTIANGENAKVDLILPYVAPSVSGPSQALIGSQTTYQISAIPLASSNDWQSVQAVPYTAVEGAEQGLANVTAQVSGYNPIATDLFASGSASYHLVHVTQDAQTIQLNPVFNVLAGAKVTFSTLLGFATPDETASLQITTNSGASWTTIWSQDGMTTSNQFESTFTHRTANLSAYAGARLQLRFTYVASGSFFNVVQKFVGFYVDDIAVTGVESLSNPVVMTLAGPGLSFNFAPATGGKYFLSARPHVGNRVFPYGNPLVVTATNHVTLPPVTKFESIAAVSGGKAQMIFDLVSGSATSYQLQAAATPKGTWQAAAGAVLTTNNVGKLVFTAPASGAQSYFKVVAQ